MNERVESIPFHVDVSRIIDVLARQIYQTPLALLRENTQNAFDAILLRQHLGGAFDPRITVSIKPSEVTVTDNGIGMTADEVRRHFWSAGSSGKNNPEARAAGVVGTFGIGAMANFGIASELEVVTESARTGERTRSVARREELSVTRECIRMLGEPSSGKPGTTVTARITGTPVQVPQAVAYLTEFVRYVAMPVEVNGTIVSGTDFSSSVKLPAVSFEISETSGSLTQGLGGTVRLIVAPTGETWLTLTEITIHGRRINGKAVLRENGNQIRTMRSGFGLAAVAVSSEYSFGGAVNSTELTPTAGREALSTESIQLIQSIVTEVSTYVSLKLANRAEANNNTNFMRWAIQKGRIDLVSELRVRLEPDNRSVALREVCGGAQPRKIHYYRGSDSAMITSFASEESPLVVISGSQPRQQCELQYLTRFCQAQEVADRPTVTAKKRTTDYTLAESGFVFRVVNVLRSDYFLEAKVELGSITHRVPIVVDPSKKPVGIILNAESDTVRLLTGLYEQDFELFGGMMKDYVRNTIFPRVADLVPSATKQGAEAFLKTIRQPREIFEIEQADLGDLSKIWSDYIEGKLTLVEAAQRSATYASSSFQIVEPSQARPIQDVLPDAVLTAQRAEEADPTADPLQAYPAVNRVSMRAGAKLLTLGPDQQPLRGYRAFLAVTDKVRYEKGDFFLQPHKTSIVWGGQKAILIFQHHSGEFGLYYELQTSRAIAEASGGGPFPTSTLAFEDAIFVPIPEPIQKAFVPEAGERKRFEVRCDLIYSEEEST